MRKNYKSQAICKIQQMSVWRWLARGKEHRGCSWSACSNSSQMPNPRNFFWGSL